MSRHRAIRQCDYDIDEVYDDEFDDEYYDPINHGDPVGASATGGKRVREHLWRVIFDGRKWYMTGGTGVPEEYYTQAVAHEEDADTLLAVIPGVLNAVGEDVEPEILVEALREANYESTIAASIVFERMSAAAEIPVQKSSKKNKKKKKKKKDDQAADLSGTDATSTSTGHSGPGGNMNVQEVPEESASASAQSTHGPTGGSRYSAAFPRTPDKLPDVPGQVQRYSEEMKPNVNLIVTGHVDAGKSTIMGHLLYQLGQVDQRLIHKYKKESENVGKGSFAYAWVLDEHEEERSRGMTVDVGINYFETTRFRFTLLDSPGHKDFVPNMITAASQADVAVLVVSLVENEFYSGLERGGQTREHATLCRAFGITKLLIAFNKIDKIRWDKAQYDSLSDKLLKHLQRIGFRQENVTLVPVSGLTGWNLHKNEEKQWYNGSTLFQELDNFDAPTVPQLKSPLRFPIADAYKTLHYGLVVSGRVESGFITPHSRVCFHPGQHTALAKGISRGPVSVEAAIPGDTVEIQLSGVEENALTSGQVACWNQYPVPVVTEFRAQIATFDTLRIPIVKGQQFILHTQHIEIPCNITKLKRTFNSDGTLAAKHPRHISRKSNAEVNIRVTKPIPMELYSSNKRLGRFVLRYSGATVAAGITLKIKS